MENCLIGGCFFLSCGDWIIYPMETESEIELYHLYIGEFACSCLNRYIYRSPSLHHRFVSTISCLFLNKKSRSSHQYPCSVIYSAAYIVPLFFEGILYCLSSIQALIFQSNRILDRFNMSCDCRVGNSGS